MTAVQCEFGSKRGMPDCLECLAKLSEIATVKAAHASRD